MKTIDFYPLAKVAIAIEMLAEELNGGDVREIVLSLQGEFMTEEYAGRLLELFSSDMEPDNTCSCHAYTCGECCCGAWDDCSGCEDCDHSWLDGWDDKDE